MSRVWVNANGDEEELLEIPFDSILDREDTKILFSIGDRQVWISNELIGKIDDFRGVFEIAESTAKENDLL